MKECLELYITIEKDGEEVGRKCISYRHTEPKKISTTDGFVKKFCDKIKKSVKPYHLKYLFEEYNNRLIN